MLAPVENCFFTEVLSLPEDPFTYRAPDSWAIRAMDLRAVALEARVAASFGGQRATLLALAERVMEIAHESAAVVRDEMWAQNDSYTMMQLEPYEEREYARFEPIVRKIRAMAAAA